MTYPVVIDIIFVREDEPLYRGAGFQADEEKVKVAVYLYGNVALMRAKCPTCGDTAIVLHGVTACCEAPVEKPSAANVHRMSEGSHTRSGPPAAERREILEAQKGRCFYCGCMFGDIIVNRDTHEEAFVKLNWDHLDPWAHSGNNRHNFVAACSICNNIKTDCIFDTREEALSYIWNRRKEKGWPNESV